MKWYWLIGITVVVIVGSFGYLRRDDFKNWFGINKSGASQEEIKEAITKRATGEGDAMDIPEDLVNNFDPTKNSPKFVVKNIDVDSKLVDLEAVWPQPWEGRLFTSVIDCGIFDSYVVSSDGKDKKLINTRDLVILIKDKMGNQMLFSGECSDLTCTKIVRKCELYVD